MDGEIGEGGIGEIEIRYGYKSFEKKVMIEVVIIIIIMVWGIKWVGESMVKSIEKRNMREW